MIHSAHPAHRANYAYSTHSVVDEMAAVHRIHYNPEGIAGMPRDTFRQSRTLTSTRTFTGPSESSVFFKKFGSFFSDLVSVLGFVGMFAPPVAAVATVASPISSAVKMATDRIDLTPKAAQVQTYGRYNYWFR
jgi:hypothetical protein